MADGSGQGCQGVLFDSGGQGASGYQNGENYTFTLCPDVPGNVIYLTFSNFDLDQSGPQNSWDNLSIYDGDNTGETYLGSYTGDALQNIIISGTVFNTSGCLTLVFQSNNVGTGVFAASFQCTIPCENPSASAVMGEAVPALVCQGETVSFNGSASQAQGNYFITQYLWDFDDGTVDSTSGPLVDHVFTDDGEHVVQLYVTDDNGCTNLNLVDLQVLVSTTPNFSFTSASQETCLGATVNIVGSAEAVTWTGIPDANFGQGIFLPDDVGLPFTSSLNFEQFNPGQTVTDISDIQSICVEMEHTYMGDLVLQVICPNGQTVILHQQGGGGTYIGSPNDFDSNQDPVIGECWQYCWTPGATNGTWVDNSQFGVTPNTMPGGSPQGQSLVPGTYESVQPISNLIGCPLNGEWTYQSTDLWGADNGFICSWSINFNPAIIPDVTQFTPTIGADADSSIWGGTQPDGLSLNGDTAIFYADQAGTYPFTYAVTDNFGCTYDTTITVTVNPQITVNAGNDVTLCNGPGQFFAFAGNTSGQPISWSWSPTAGLSNPNIANPTVQVTSETVYTVTGFITGHPECAVSDQVTAFLDPGLDPGTDSSITVCAYPPIFDMTTMLGGTPQPGGVWTDANNNVVPANFDPSTDAAGTYTYTLTTQLGCIGTADLDITVISASDPTCCGIVDAGPDAVSCNLTYALSASIGNTGTGQWSGPAGYTFGDAQSPSTNVVASAGGSAKFFWIEDDGALCYLIDSVTVIFTEPMAATVAVVDAVCFEACDGSASVTMVGGNGAFTYDWSANVAGANDAQAVDLCAGTYTVDVADENECTTSGEYTVGQPVLLEIDATSFNEPWCNGACDGSLTITDTEAVEYSFNGGSTYVSEATLGAVCAGTYQVAIKNADQCVGTAQVIVTEPPLVVADFNHNPIPANIDAPTITFQNISENSTGWQWDIAGLMSTTEYNPVFTFSERYPGVYPVCLTAIDDHGCLDTTCHDVVIDNVLYTFIPNTFTPDANGVNDSWGMMRNMDNIAFFELQVFDRWGQEVFTTEDPTIWWDGTQQNGGGEVLKEGVYIFRWVYQVVSTGAWREGMGHVTLLK